MKQSLNLHTLHKRIKNRWKETARKSKSKTFFTKTKKKGGTFLNHTILKVSKGVAVTHTHMHIYTLSHTPAQTHTHTQHAN